MASNKTHLPVGLHVHYVNLKTHTQSDFDAKLILVSGVRLFPVYPSPNIKLLSIRVNLPNNHGNHLLYITHNHATMDILSWHVYKGIHYHYNQNDP